MNARYKRWLLVAGVALVGIIAALLWGLRSGDETDRPPDPRMTRSQVRLYFAGQQSALLAGEDRVIEHLDTPTDQASAIVRELIRGPESDRTGTIPDGTALLGLRIDEGIVYVDLSGDVSENHPGGSESELMTIYSIVNSLTENVAGVKAVRILIEGDPVNTLAGHIDLRTPLQADTHLIP